MDDREDFDWVSARWKCTPERMLLRLRAVVARDVDRAAELGIRAELKDSPEPVGAFCVVVEPPAGSVTEIGGMRLIFLVGEEIRCTDGGDRRIFEAPLQRLQDGRCALRIGGKDLRPWQVSQRALEGLFFPG